MWESILGPNRTTQITIYLGAEKWDLQADNYGKKTDKHSWYLIFPAFPHKQWLHESTSMLRRTYIAWLISLSTHTRARAHARTKHACTHVHTIQIQRIFQPQCYAANFRVWKSVKWTNREHKCLNIKTMRSKHEAQKVHAYVKCHSGG